MDVRGPTSSSNVTLKIRIDLFGEKRITLSHTTSLHMLGSFASGNWLLYGRAKQMKRSPRVEETLCREEIGVFNVETFLAAHTDTIHVESFIGNKRVD